MKHRWILLFALIPVFMFANSAVAQTEKVVIYSAPGFQGANMALDGNWSGGPLFDRKISSIRVPPGYRVTIYADKNYKGTEANLTEDWNPGAGAWWINRIRSIRVVRAQIQPPVQPPASDSFPVIYAQPNFQGPAEAVERDWPGRRDWGGHPHLIRSIRVPPGWKLRLYERQNFGGTETVITANISWEPGAYWNGRVRSIRVSRDTNPSPSSFPVIYAQANLQGPAMAVERDWPGSKDWDGRPHQIRSLRVPTGWFMVLYDKTNFRGKSYNLTSDWSPQPGDYWYGRIRSIKVYKGAPPIQPR